MEKTCCQIYDKKWEKNDEWNNDSGPHIQKIEESRYQSSESKSAAIAHKDLGGMDIIEHKCYKYGYDDRYYCSSDIGLIEEEHDSENKENNSHQSSC